jgi:hypothetical protein
MYKLTKNKPKNVFEIFEIQTEKVITEYSDYDAARTYYRFLKNGGAFSGWTPDFVTKHYKLFRG